MNLTTKSAMMVAGLAACLLSTTQAMAKVSPEEAERLGKDLTPLGAEMAGNADGTIPAWTGGGVGEIPASFKPGGHHPDPFADEEPLFVITAENVDQYADKLTEGQRALFKTYPETYKMKVYPTHRTALSPEWIYKRTMDCATTAELANNGNSIKGAHACYPFPIPKDGSEVMWNHLLSYLGNYREDKFNSASPDANGRYVVDKLERYYYLPYWDVEKANDERLSMFIPRQLAPARVAGDTFLLIDFLNPADKPRQAWKYFGGQRRVRRAPVFVFDTPIPSSGGLRTVDVFNLFFGSLERYNWELKGKKEIYIPYNSYKLGAGGVKDEEVLQVGHINPELPRYELHRVWVVDAVLKDGQRHIYPRRTLYIDEDTWQAHIHDMYDDHGGLWRTAHRHTKLYWDSEIVAEANEVHHDLVSRRYNAVTMMGEYDRPINFSKPRPGEAFFTASGIRKMGVR